MIMRSCRYRLGVLAGGGAQQEPSLDGLVQQLADCAKISPAAAKGEVHENVCDAQ